MADTLGKAWLCRALGLGEYEEPFPWQIELLKGFLRGDDIQALDIPTGLGKTATMAIWMVARALGAKLPRRLVYVVDRRAVVDQATEEAERIRRVVDEMPEIKSALKLSRSLPISTLRGQYVDNREWLEDPSLPAIVVGTVDLIGSRLLFEGYRSSRKMRPYHAALLGADALIVLDEAHLVPAFEAMVRAAVDNESLKPQLSRRDAIPFSRVMSLSATSRFASNAFRLGEKDHQHKIVRQRLDAKKHVLVSEPVEVDTLAKTLADKAWRLTDNGDRAVRVVVFVDSRKIAQQVVDAIEGLAKGDGSDLKREVETELFVGGRRVAEREEAARRLAALGLFAGFRERPAKPVFVIATSAGEVGVDLDADHAVLDLVEWERMVQRLGRVNRRGEGVADVCIVSTTLDDKTKDALEKEDKILKARKASDAEESNGDDGGDDDGADDKLPKRLSDDERVRVDRWNRRQASLRAVGCLPQVDGMHEASPRTLTQLKKEHPSLIEAASTPAPLHPQLTRAVIEAWSMTSLEEHTGRPNVRPWLRGWVDEESQTTIAWRNWLPLKSDAKTFFEAASVETAECLETETVNVMDWLAKRVRQILKTQTKVSQRAPADGEHEHDGIETSSKPVPLTPNDTVMYVLDERRRAWTLAALDALDKKQRDELLRDISGETIVVDTRLGGLDERGLLDAKSPTATDVSEREDAGLPFRVRRVETLDLLEASDGWRMEATFVSRRNDAGEAVAWLIVETNPNQPATTEDGRSTTGHEQPLDEHQSSAARHAREIGRRIGLSPTYVDLLALAAVLHDEGKKAERWQRAFRAPQEKRPLGKTTSRPVQSILAGYRHELGSLPYAERDPRVAALSQEDRDLLLHLIAAHHGFARPLLRTDGCEDAPPSLLVERAQTIALRFARLERRWGPWGLAWWETLLRAADQNASRENDEHGGKRG